ncbi:hypothetical protein NDU88_006847 [Pleurodeles waltl]|uniref:Uncharacterized protein n=1 Tax=Pleurodeles waltl TaxID=8319 RepID=A0AAV7M1A2_PLEWA|nr:hypothetical protein NDU88_006847 [Pleurodeles waltl]
MESRAPCARAVAASRSLAPPTRTHRTPANAPSSDGEQSALCQGRGCFQEPGPPTRAHGPLPKRHPLRWRAERHATGPWRLPGIWLHYLYSQDPCQRAILRWGAVCPVRGPWLLPGVWPPHPYSRAPAKAPPSPMESRAPCARALAPSRSLAPSTRTHRTPANAPPSLMESSVPCARAVAASRSLAPPPVLTGPCQRATLSDGEQCALCQGRGCF